MDTATIVAIFIAILGGLSAVVWWVITDSKTQINEAKILLTTQLTDSKNQINFYIGTVEKNMKEDVTRLEHTDGKMSDRFDKLAETLPKDYATKEDMRVQTDIMKSMKGDISNMGQSLENRIDKFEVKLDRALSNK